MFRQLLVILVATAVSIAFSFLLYYWRNYYAVGSYSYFGPQSWSYELIGAAIRTLGNLLPGVIIGAWLSSRQILCGAFVTALVAAAVQAVYYLYVSDEIPQWRFLMATVVESGAYGSAGAALGFVALGANYSLKRTAADGLR